MLQSERHVNSIIINCLSPSVYPCVEDTSDYGDVVRMLKSLYVKQKNNVYARHLLVSRHQLQGETICEYLQVLKSLAKDCTFSDGTVATHREELTRVAFINGLLSASIRQTLLEKSEITLVQVFVLTESLDRVQRQAFFMGQSSTRPLSSAAFDDRRRAFHGERSIVLSTCRSDNEQNCYPPLTCPSAAVAQRQVNKEMIKTLGKRCFFCGGQFHPRYSSPACDATCFSFGNAGHFARVCQSKTRTEPNLLSVPLLLHQSKNCILLVLLQFLNLLWLTAY